MGFPVVGSATSPYVNTGRNVQKWQNDRNVHHVSGVKGQGQSHVLKGSLNGKKYKHKWRGHYQC